MLIYKIFHAAEWHVLDGDGDTFGSHVDLEDGYIHFSTKETLDETARKHFLGAENLVLAACEADDFGEALKWEVSRGGVEFPHLYGVLKRKDVLWHRTLPQITATFTWDGVQ